MINLRLNNEKSNHWKFISKKCYILCLFNEIGIEDGIKIGIRHFNFQENNTMDLVTLSVNLNECKKINLPIFKKKTYVCYFN